MELTQPDWSLAPAGAEEGAGQGKGQRRSGMADERGRTLGGQDAWAGVVEHDDGVGTAR